MGCLWSGSLVRSKISQWYFKNFVHSFWDQIEAFPFPQTQAKPAFSDDLRKFCRMRLLTCLAHLTGQTTTLRSGHLFLHATSPLLDLISRGYTDKDARRHF